MAAPTLEMVSFSVSAASLVIAFAAGVLALLAWKRPLHPDPRAIPTHGTARRPATIAATDDGRRFFAFLDENEGRKIRIFASVDEAAVSVDEDDSLSSSQLSISWPPEAGVASWDVLVIRGVGEDAPGITRRHGAWFINGYFACSGLAFIGQGSREWSITAIDVVTAVT